MIQLVLAMLVQYMVAKCYYIAALNGWFNGRFLGMDFLVVLGTTAAYTFSVVTFIKHLLENSDTGMKEAAFETGGMLFTFVTLGKFLEAYLRQGQDSKCIADVDGATASHGAQGDKHGKFFRRTCRTIITAN